MEHENQPLPEIEKPVQSSLVERLTNVIVSPGDAFAELRGMPVNPVNWAIPLVISILAGIVFTVTIFSQGNVLERMQQDQATQLEKQVEQGKMSEQQAENARKAMEQFMNPKLMMAAGSAATIFFTPVAWVLMAFVFHWVVRIGSQSHIPFTKCFEVIGLASVVSVLGVAVNLLLVIITGNMNMTLSLALAVQDFDPTNSTHALASIVDLTQIWWVAVMAVAWSRLTNHPVATCGAWLFGIYVVLRVSMVLLFV